MKHCSILVVCTDNLCRSPIAEEVIRQKARQQGLGEKVFVASAATHDLNVGEPADIRAQKHAMRREYDLSRFRARLLEADDFEHFDLLLTVDESTLLMLRMRCPPSCHHKLQHLMQYASRSEALDVPDPFYGKSNDFEAVLDAIEDASDGLLAHLQAQLT